MKEAGPENKNAPVITKVGECDELRIVNRKLRRKVDILQGLLNDRENSLDITKTELSQEKYLRSKLEDELRKSRAEVAQLNARIHEVEEEKKTLEIDAEKLKVRIKEMKGLNDENERILISYQNSLDSALDKIAALRQDSMRLEAALENKDEELEDSQQIIEELTSEAGDKILARQRIVHFNGEVYDYGDDLLFVPFQSSTYQKTAIDENVGYKLKRLQKLIRKYDSKVKVKLVGVSSEVNEQDRIRLASRRPDYLRHFLILEPYNFRSSDFHGQRSNDFERRNMHKFGVNIQIVAR